MGKLSFGEIRLRPDVKGWGLLATSPGTINKELLILEKKERINHLIFIQRQKILFSIIK